ncbi:NAD(P)H-binding protein [Halomonas sp. LBP4]|uniref:NAD(P)H-binding protein n=1 Tax=Halomonas sp. LBP4 TaxID=2044917 RepID=UPI0021AD4203|nr:NAD(P)H-binding protein [Halomonas sp. LBP4]
MGDANDRVGLADALRGHDAVISAVHFATSDADTLVGAVREAGVRRYLVVGGAGRPRARGYPARRLAASGRG